MKIKKVVLNVLVVTFFILFLFIFFYLGKTYSKYSKNLKIKSISGIAKPCFALNKESILEKKSLNLDVVSYEFVVQNYEAKKVSETSFIYNIGFNISQENAPVVIKLYRVYENEEKELELVNNFTSIPEKIGVCEEKACYKVKIYYDLNSDVVMNKNIEINVKINAIQEEVNI